MAAEARGLTGRRWPRAVRPEATRQKPSTRKRLPERTFPCSGGDPRTLRSSGRQFPTRPTPQSGDQRLRIHIRARGSGRARGWGAHWDGACDCQLRAAARTARGERRGAPVGWPGACTAIFAPRAPHSAPHRREHPPCYCFGSDNARLNRLLTKAMRYPSPKPFRGGCEICRCECAHVISSLASS